MPSKTESYHSYLLRIWLERGDAHELGSEGNQQNRPKTIPWQYSLEKIGSGRKRGFASLTELFATLEQELDTKSYDNT